MCHTKIRYSTKQDAEESIEEYSQRIPINFMQVYECLTHQCWHKGHGRSQEELREVWMLMNWWKLNEQGELIWD